ncbi:MAG: hypothetical protein ACI85O_000924 [Saprospiraceae bacterium]|jgi:hypothetical protein
MNINLSDKRTYHPEHSPIMLPFPLPIIQGKKMKKKCCRKFKKGKRCKRCPANAKMFL